MAPAAAMVRSSAVASKASTQSVNSGAAMASTVPFGGATPLDAEGVQTEARSECQGSGETQGDHGETDDQLALIRQVLGALLGLVDTDEHDDEQKQRHDGPGVHDDLHRSHQVGEVDDVDHAEQKSVPSNPIAEWTGLRAKTTVKAPATEVIARIAKRTSSTISGP